MSNRSAPFDRKLYRRARKNRNKDLAMSGLATGVGGLVAGFIQERNRAKQEKTTRGLLERIDPALAESADGISPGDALSAYIANERNKAYSAKEGRELKDTRVKDRIAQLNSNSVATARELGVLNDQVFNGIITADEYKQIAGPKTDLLHRISAEIEQLNQHGIDGAQTGAPDPSAMGYGGEDEAPRMAQRQPAAATVAQQPRAQAPAPRTMDDVIRETMRSEVASASQLAPRAPETIGQRPMTDFTPKGIGGGPFADMNPANYSLVDKLKATGQAVGDMVGNGMRALTGKTGASMAADSSQNLLERQRAAQAARDALTPIRSQPYQDALPNSPTFGSGAPPQPAFGAPTLSTGQPIRTEAERDAWLRANGLIR